MKKYLLFYKVNNSKQYGRHEFDLCYDDFDACMEKLEKLGSDEWSMFHTEEFGRLDFTRPLGEFMEEFNDSVFENCAYWCAVLVKKD